MRIVLIFIITTLPFQGHFTSLAAEEKVNAGIHSELVKKGLDFLAAKQGGGGPIPIPNIHYISDGTISSDCVIGLAWIMSGSTLDRGPYKKNLVNLTNHILSIPLVKPSDRNAKSHSSQFNWTTGFMLMYLSQVAKLGKTDLVKEKIEELIKLSGKAQYDCGGWTHGYMGKNSLDYDHFVAVSLVILNGLGMAQQTGFFVPEEIVSKGFQYVKDSTSGPRVGYSPRKGQKGIPKGSGRIAAAYSALMRFEMGDDNFTKQITPTVRFIDAVGKGHADGMFHYFFSAITAHSIGGEVWEAFKEQIVSKIPRLAKPDGSFSMIPRTGEETKKSVLGAGWDTAICCLILSLESNPYLLLTNFSQKFRDDNGRVILNKAVINNVASDMGDRIPDSLKEMVEEINQLKASDKSYFRQIKKIYDKNIKTIVLDISKLENEKIKSAAIKNILGLSFDKVTATLKKRSRSSWDLSLNINPAIYGSLTGSVIFSSDTETAFKNPYKSSVSVSSKYKTLKRNITLNNKDLSTFDVNITINLIWNKIPITFTDKLTLKVPKKEA